MEERWMYRAIKTGLCALALCTTALTSPALAQARPADPARATKPAPAAQRPNILLVLSDDNSVPHDGCHPNANTRPLGLTRNLEAFAAQGMCFERAYTTAPQCAPSRASIFAGRNPVDLGVTRFAQPVRRDIPFFSDILRASGYWVGLEGRNHHLSGRGDDPPHVKQVLAETGLSAIGERFDYVDTVNFKKDPPERARQLLGQALDKVPSGKPFFLYFGFNQTHRPFVADSRDIDPSKLQLPPDWPDLPEVRQDYANYLADLRAMDRGFGAMMVELKARGLADNTIVVFMGDNGDSLYRGKGTLYERGNHVPLIVRWPGVVKPGSRNAALVSGVDLAPTFLRAAGLRPDPKMSGVDLAPVLGGAADTGRKFMVTERGWHPGGLNVSEGLDYARAITAQRYKLIYNAQPAQPYSPVDQGGRFLDKTSGGEEGEIKGEAMPAVAKTDEERATPSWRAVVKAHQAKTLSPTIERIYFKRPRPIFELYDLEKDPFELTNLAGRLELKPVETELRQELDKWMAVNGDYLPFATDAYKETPDPAS
jgi:N-sulfoglucosamine sulfohydrolase